MWTTLLCVVKSILNSQSLTSINDNSTDFEALIPNHVLLGSSQPNIESSNLEDVEVNYRKKYGAVKAFLEKMVTE